MIRIMLSLVGLMMVASTMSRNSTGMASAASTMRIMTVSSTPPK